MPGYRPIELRLMQEMTQSRVAIGTSESEARKTVAEAMPQIIEVSKRRGWYDAGPLADRLLADPALKPYFDWAREYYGVTDADIHLWWDMDEVERIAAEYEDQGAATGVYFTALEKGMPVDDAAKKVWQVLPNYDYDFGRQSQGRSLLPAELKPRITDYVLKLAATGGNKHPAEAYSTFNEWVLVAIAAGLF